MRGEWMHHWIRLWSEEKLYGHALLATFLLQSWRS